MENCNVSIACTALKINHENIVQDIQGDVIQALFDQQVLTENEFKKIKSLVSVKNKYILPPTYQF